jgi:excinuclease ABC subunit C
MLAPLTADRERASAELDFERAAELHAQWQKVKAAAALADSLVQPIPRLRAIILQKAAKKGVKAGAPHLDSEMWVDEAASSLSSRSAPLLSSRSEAEGSASPGTATEPEPAAAVFLLHSGCLTGPARLSVLGVRAVKEQTSVGSSLFAQPLMLQAIPLEEESPTPEVSDAVSQSSVILSEGPGTEPEDSQLPSQSSVILSEDATPVASESKDLRVSSQDSTTPALSPELRAAALIAGLEAQATAPTDLATLSDHLSLLRRWYYRPEKQRAGEVLFPREDSAGQTTWPIRRILNGAARISLGDPKPMAETQRDLAIRNPEDATQKPTRTRTLHAGRPDVERTVPVLEKNPDKPPTSKSRRKSQPT